MKEVPRNHRTKGNFEDEPASWTLARFFERTEDERGREKRTNRSVVVSTIQSTEQQTNEVRGGCAPLQGDHGLISVQTGSRVPSEPSKQRQRQRRHSFEEVLIFETSSGVSVMVDVAIRT